MACSQRKRRLLPVQAGVQRNFAPLGDDTSAVNLPARKSADIGVYSQPLTSHCPQQPGTGGRPLCQR